MPILGEGGNENRRRLRSNVKNSWRSLFTNGSQRFSSKSHRRDLISSLNLTRLPSESRRIFALVNHRETVRGRLIIDRCGKYMQNAWLRVACSTPCTHIRNRNRDGNNGFALHESYRKNIAISNRLPSPSPGK